MHYSDRLVRPRQLVGLMAVIALIGLGMWFFMRPQEVDYAAARRVAARDLAGAFQASAASAGEVYGGKPVRVRGRVAQVGQSPAGYIYLLFSEPVACVMARPDSARAKKLVAGAWVEVGGVVRGLAADGVVVQGCRLLD